MVNKGARVGGGARTKTKVPVNVRGKRPVYVQDVKARAVSEVPDHAPRRTDLWRALERVMREVGKGKAVPIAEYRSKAGARTVAREIRRGEREVPGGGKGWLFASRTTEEGSVLWATWKG